MAGCHQARKAGPPGVLTFGPLGSAAPGVANSGADPAQSSTGVDLAGNETEEDLGKAASWTPTSPIRR